MIQPQLPDDRRPPLTPQLALRVTLIGGFALTMFAIVLFRLWFLQVLSGNQYVAQAKQNRTRKVLVAAPRGEIVDRNGAVLVRSRQATAVQIVPTQLPVPVKDPTIADLRSPPAADRALYARLAGVLGISTATQKCKVIGYKQVHGKSFKVIHRLRLPLIACDVAQAVYGLPYADATVATDVKQDVLFYLKERHAAFPGVGEPQVYLTSYPGSTLAAQVLGTVGPVTKAELGQSQFRGLPQSSVVGQTGLEYYYDRYLRGVDGAEQVEVDSVGNPIRVLPQKPAIAGNTLKTSLDLGLQKIGQASLAQSISGNTPGGAGGAFVAMDPQNGQIYAMGSLPSYDPNIFTKPISQSVYNGLISATSGDPLNNRAVDGLYPTGSTFKPITATAALESGVWSLSDTYDDTGQYCFTQGGLCLHNAGNVANGSLDLVSAIKVSDDVFFYNLGAKLNVDPQTHPLGGPLQQWARLFGIGRSTGIDLPYEASGNLPDPKWRAAISRVEVQYEKKHHTGCCTIAYPGPWTVGDNVNLAVGQGDVLVTPLQLAVAYSAIANGGTIVRPHIGLQVENNIGDKALQKIDPPAAGHININPAYLDAIRTGLRQAASAPGGTSASVMGSFPMPVYGKTGTAQHVGQNDQAWYVCFVPATATSKPITVVVTVEKGGFGAVAAAPVARQILSQWFTSKPGPYLAGTSKTL
ncbi:MAG TPA: penicillin-binding protein 2 [Solirubrobacteraceae bacterium]|jgi:penicillin-binding protein 2|nr:penicillin-binding protein 2 [Solirubrobacteraceae bacterium]